MFDILESWNEQADTGPNDGILSKWIDASYGSLAAGSMSFLTNLAICAWGRMLRMNNGSGDAHALRRVRGANRAGFSDGFWMAYMNLGPAALTNQRFWSALDSGTMQLSLHLSTDGSLQLRNNGATVLGAAPAGTILTDTLYHYEITAEIGAAAPFSVKVNGVEVIAGVGDTQNTANAYTNEIFLQCADGAAGQGYGLFKDIFCWSAAETKGQIRSERLNILADVLAAWTRSGGAANVECIDEAQVAIADYLDAMVNGTADRYTLSDMAALPLSIAALKLMGYGRCTDSVTRQINLQVHSGAVTSDGPNLALTSNTNKFERTVEVDPETGLPWTEAGINGFELGLKLVA